MDASERETAPEETPALPDWRSLWDFSDPASSEARLREALAAGEAAGDAAYVAIVTTQLARARGLQREFAEAHALLDGLEPGLTEAPLELRMRYLLERGRVHNSAGEGPEACACFEEAWKLGQGAGLDALTADAGHMLAIAAPPDEALRWAERTMSFCEASTDERCQGWLGPLYNNTGWTYHDLGRFEEALDLWRKGLAYRESRGAPEPIFIARWTVARGLRSLGRVEEALAAQESLHADRAAANARGAGYVEEEIGECLLALGRADEARPWFAEAHARLAEDDWIRAEEPERLERLLQLSR